jgi:hypothetical protein
VHIVNSPPCSEVRRASRYRRRPPGARRQTKPGIAWATACRLRDEYAISNPAAATATGGQPTGVEKCKANTARLGARQPTWLGDGLADGLRVSINVPYDVAPMGVAHHRLRSRHPRCRRAATRRVVRYPPSSCHHGWGYCWLRCARALRPSYTPIQRNSARLGLMPVDCQRPTVYDLARLFRSNAAGPVEWFRRLDPRFAPAGRSRAFIPCLALAKSAENMQVDAKR